MPLLSFAPFRWLSRHSQWTRRTCRCFGKLGIPGIPRNLLAIMAIWNAKVWFQTIRPWGITVGLGKHRSGVSNPCRDAAMQHLGLTSNRGKGLKAPRETGTEPWLFYVTNQLFPWVLLYLPVLLANLLLLCCLTILSLVEWFLATTPFFVDCLLVNSFEHCSKSLFMRSSAGIILTQMWAL